ncbi:MAG: carbohydrate ABC transporter permease [Bacillota bacterium]
MASQQFRKMNPKKFHKNQLIFYAYLIPLCFFMALPIVFIFFHAFKPIDELFAFPPRFFVINPSLDNFRNLFKRTSVTGIPMSRYLFNSLIVTVLMVVSTVIISSMAGFAFSKLKFKFKHILFEINTLALMFVGIAVIVPRYLVIQELGLIDNFFVHVLPLLAIPVGLFLLKQFVDQIPNELIEAARVDGATDLYIYWHIILPLIKPAIATVAILAFQTIWINVETSNLYINSDGKRTLAFYMMTLTTQTGNTVAGQGLAAAATLIMFVPNLILFIILQRNVMDTMAHSGIK